MPFDKNNVGAGIQGAESGPVYTAPIARTSLANMPSAASSSIDSKYFVTDCGFSTHVTRCVVKCILFDGVNKWYTEIITTDAQPLATVFPSDWIVRWVQQS